MCKMWYSETLIIVHKGKSKNAYSTNKRATGNTTVYTGHNGPLSTRTHNCDNYARLCRYLTCPNSGNLYLSNILPCKLPNGKAVFKVIHSVVLCPLECYNHLLFTETLLITCSMTIFVVKKNIKVIRILYVFGRKYLTF